MQEGHQSRILLLDDEQFLLNIYKITFEKKGWEVAAYTNADDALAALKAGFAPDAILFDLTMPDGRSGYEFIEEISRSGLAKGSVKIALTNASQDGEQMRTKELGADAHLIKSKFIPVEIEEKVHELLAQKQATA